MPSRIGLCGTRRFKQSQPHFSTWMCPRSLLMKQRAGDPLINLTSFDNWRLLGLTFPDFVPFPLAGSFAHPLHAESDLCRPRWAAPAGPRRGLHPIRACGVLQGHPAATAGLTPGR